MIKLIRKMSNKTDSHKSRLESTFSVSKNNKEDLFDYEEREQDPQYEKPKVKNSEKTIDFEKSRNMLGRNSEKRRF